MRAQSYANTIGESTAKSMLPFRWRKNASLRPRKVVFTNASGDVFAASATAEREELYVSHLICCDHRGVEEIRAFAVDEGLTDQSRRAALFRQEAHRDVRRRTAAGLVTKVRVHLASDEAGRQHCFLVGQGHCVRPVGAEAVRHEHRERGACSLSLRDRVTL